MGGRSSVRLLLAAGLAWAAMAGLLSWGCRQDPDNIFLPSNGENELVFRDLYLSLGADCLLVAGVDIPMRAVAQFSISGSSAAEQDWTNRVQWFVPDSTFGTVTSLGVFRARHSGTGEVMVVSPEGWMGSRTMRIRQINSLSLALDEPLIFRGDTTGLTLEVLLSGGYHQTMPERVPVTWQFSDPSAAAQCGARCLTGVHAGVTTVTASVLGAVSTPVLLSVDSLISLTCAAVDSGACLPMETASYRADAITQLVGRLPVTDRATWVSSDPVRLVALGNGGFVPSAPGNYAVHAELFGVSSSTVPLEVWNVTSLNISPDAVEDTLHRGDTLQFTALGEVENHGLQDLTKHAQWVVGANQCGRFVVPGMFVAGSAGASRVWARVGAITTTEVMIPIAATPVFTETFESYAYGDMLSDSRWEVYTNYPSRPVISNVAGGGTHSCMLLDSSYSGYCSIQTNSGIFEVVPAGVAEADVMTEGNGVFIRLGATYGMLGYVNFSDGSVVGYDGGSYVQLQTYYVNRWYHVSMDFDCATGTYDVFIDGVRRGEGLAFYNNATGVSQITLGTSSSEVGNRSYVDNIALSE